MSHIAQIVSEIRDLAALERACQSLGVSLEGQGKVRFYGGVQDADRVIKLPGKYDIGFRQNQDSENYAVIADSECFYDQDNGRNTEARKVFGPKCDRLFEEYNYEILSAQAAISGQTITRTEAEGGGIEVLLESY